MYKKIILLCHFLILAHIPMVFRTKPWDRVNYLYMYDVGANVIKHYMFMGNALAFILGVFYVITQKSSEDFWDKWIRGVTTLLFVWLSYFGYLFYMARNM